MGVMIGHASKDENNGGHGGQAGDQTGREVYTIPWYVGGWSVLLRPKDPDVAERMARFCEDVCANPNVGYDKQQRNTLRREALVAGWNGAAIKTPCETDCSAFMTVCAEAAGVDMSRCYSGGNAPVTQGMREQFTSTGAFTALIDGKYLVTDKYLRRGDILVRELGHTCMVLTDGERVIEDMTGKDILDRLTDAEAWELVEKANRHAATLKPSEYAEAACKKGVASGLFSDGDHDGLVDNPQAFMKRQELATVLDRAGLYAPTGEGDDRK